MNGEMDPCVRLAWDSEFFGLSMARVCGQTLDDARAAAVEAWCRRERVGCAYFLARADDPATSQCAEKHGYSLVDIRVELECKLTADDATQPSTNARLAVESDLPALESIARESFTDSRFYADGHFPRAKCDALYVRWVQESLRGFADAVLVTPQQGPSAAFVTCKLEEAGAAGRIGLLGVDPRQRGHGLGQKIVHEALAWFAAGGARRVRVVTQGRNIASQRLYQRCGFLTHSVGLYYHKWWSID